MYPIHMDRLTDPAGTVPALYPHARFAYLGSAEPEGTGNLKTPMACHLKLSVLVKGHAPYENTTWVTVSNDSIIAGQGLCDEDHSAIAVGLTPLLELSCWGCLSE
jgi:hypothetical protein